ncbi:hypothetical protein ENUP19_0208G0004 [Entamoeba nuttalli]|uniref:Uncharacterized protein n=1 Tax=Entamoeba nuttalli TaxID=412467 RepID=A0ABQ0DP09_9EUKA
MKKVENEECKGINIEKDVKGKDVKLIKCQNMKINDTSNSNKQNECDNVEVITEQQNEMIGRFGMGGGNNMPMGMFRNLFIK